MSDICWHVVGVECFYKALFSTLEQTHCALVACDSKWVAVAFYSAFLNFHKGGVFTVLFACYMAAAISARSVYTIQPCTMSHHFMQSHIWRTLACLAVTCHLHFWQNDWDIFYATAVTQVGMDTKIRVSTESWTEEENSPAAPAGTQTHDLSIMSLAL